MRDPRGWALSNVWDKADCYASRHTFQVTVQPLAENCINVLNSIYFLRRILLPFLLHVLLLKGLIIRRSSALLRSLIQPRGFWKFKGARGPHKRHLLQAPNPSGTIHLRFLFSSRGRGWSAFNFKTILKLSFSATLIPIPATLIKWDYGKLMRLRRSLWSHSPRWVIPKCLWLSIGE